ncbi:MAG: hypothetical protein ACHRHE_01575 [Tepidisphaerales bacterium]
MSGRPVRTAGWRSSCSKNFRLYREVVEELRRRLDELESCHT